MALVVFRVASITELKTMSLNETRSLYFRWLTYYSRGLA